MAQVVDSPHSRLGSESDEEIDIELGTRPSLSSVATPDEGNSEHDSASLLVTGSRRKRVRMTFLTVSFLLLLGVSIGLTARFSRDRPKTLNAMTGEEISFGSLETVGGKDVQMGKVVPFLDVQFSPDDRALFVLSKEHWNASFIVYPTVVKRAAPVKVGLEPGGILLSTNDFAFHFELSPNRRYLELVQEYHYANLHGSNAEELQQMFGDSQWPGYVTKVPIYAETDSAYYIPTDIFLANGFFVAPPLASPDFTALEDPSESFARNTVLFVEYELHSGVIMVNYAIGLLPDEIIPQRAADDRVGYFAKRYTQYSLSDQEDDNGYHRLDSQMTVIHRRKLELDATMNTTKEPIRYYIDPSVPMEWREAFAAGVNAWIPAFERIGFPNAIRAVLPGDSDWPTDYRRGDLRYNSISAMISERTYAYGPTVIDPRSGEILHSDIVFEYGFFNEVMADFDVQSPVDPPKSRSTADATDGTNTDAENPLKSDNGRQHSRTGRSRQCGLADESQHQLDRTLLRSVVADENGYVPTRLIAQHFADIVMHEVGHTLGLRHNFAGSSEYSREQLREPAFVAEHGISTSIMDYLPVNIFSDLTADEAEHHGFFMTTIGAYDYAAIAYGYSIVLDEVPGYKHPHLTELAAAAPLFLTDESVDNMLNPFAQKFDLSSNLVDFAADRLRFVQNTRSSNAVLPKVPEDAAGTTLWQRERNQLHILEQAIKFVRPLLGGVNATHAHRGKEEGSYQVPFVPKDTQLAALNVLQRIIRAESGLFPSPKDYASYMEVVGFHDEDCNEPTLEYSCLGRGRVDVGAYILKIREKAVISALFPAMVRIVQQDVLSPLTLKELLTEVNESTNAQPVNYALTDFLNEFLQFTLGKRETDSRIKKAVEEQFGMTEPPVVVVQAKENTGTTTQVGTYRYT